MQVYNNFSPNITIYYGESLEDLDLMPTTTMAGRGKYNCGLAEKGSIAQILTPEGLKIYMLRSSGWIDVTDSSIMEYLM